MKLCIAEKPSVARDIAVVLGAKQRCDGYFQGNGYAVTWTFGHLCTLKEPHDYQPTWKHWRIEDLPIIPANFGIKLLENNGVQKQFSIIQRLVSECHEVINCGDAGQEGELIQRWVLLKAKCKAPIKRLWISSLTEEAIREGFQRLSEASKYDSLYAAGNARAIGDWLLGINATRLFTVKFRSAQQTSVLSIGRVQTPTLALIVERQKEIDSFEGKDYWELKTIYRRTEFLCQIARLKTAQKAQKGLEYIKNKPFEIVSFERKEGKEGNPRLYDLTSLQVEANKLYAYSAEETLRYVQNLYEKKIVSYPRVDTTYLSEDLHPKVTGILQKMDQYSTFIEKLLQQPIPKLKTVFDDKKVSDHHAIIPTGVRPSAINEQEQKIYDLIARRFIAVFYPECKVSNTTVIGKVDALEFKATGKQMLSLGWRELYTETAKTDKNTDESDMPEFVKGETGPHAPKVHQGKTTPPKHYTEATLLRAMETAGKLVEDEHMRELMKENGIGRPSTRANIIETLFSRKYIERKRKNLIATATGIALIDSIQNELLKSATLTGQWEKKLRQIEKGDYRPEVFKHELCQMVKELTDEVVFNTPSHLFAQAIQAQSGLSAKTTVSSIKTKSKLEQLSCPKCKKHLLVKGKNAVGCSNFSVCGFKIPYEILGKKLTETHLIQLITKGKTSTIKDLIIPNSSTPRSGRLVLNPISWNIELTK